MSKFNVTKKNETEFYEVVVSKSLKKLEEINERFNDKKQVLKLKELKISTDSLLEYLAVENLFNSHLSYDYSNVNFVENAKCEMYPKLIPGIPPILDDIYIAQYIFEGEVYYEEVKGKQTGRIFLIDEEHIKKNGGVINPDDKTPGQIYQNAHRIIVEKHLGYKCPQTKIVHTPKITSEGEIVTTMERENLKSKNVIKTNAIKFKRTKENPNPVIVGVSETKINTDFIPIEKLIKKLPIINKELNLMGASIIQVDYTLDILGTLERFKLYQTYLNSGLFIERRKQKQFYNDILNSFLDENLDENGEKIFLSIRRSNRGRKKSRG